MLSWNDRPEREKAFSFQRGRVQKLKKAAKKGLTQSRQSFFDRYDRITGKAKNQPAHLRRKLSRRFRIPASPVLRTGLPVVSHWRRPVHPQAGPDDRSNAQPAADRGVR